MLRRRLNYYVVIQRDQDARLVIDYLPDVLSDSMAVVRLLQQCVNKPTSDHTVLSLELLDCPC